MLEANEWGSEETNPPGVSAAGDIQRRPAAAGTRYKTAEFRAALRICIC